MLGSLGPPGSRHPPLQEGGGRHSHLELNIVKTDWTRHLIYTAAIFYTCLDTNCFIYKLIPEKKFDKIYSQNVIKLKSNFLFFII